MLSRAKHIKVPGYAYRFDIETYHRLCESGLLPRNLELINGILVEKMTISPRHSYVVARLRQLLSVHLSPDFHIREEKPLTIQNSEPEPDLAVVAGSIADYRSRHPETAEFVIEVSQTTLERDRAKATIYSSAGIPEFWIVDLEARRFEVNRRPSPEGYHEQIISGAEEAIPLPGGFAPAKIQFRDLD